MRRRSPYHPKQIVNTGDVLFHKNHEKAISYFTHITTLCTTGTMVEAIN